MLIMGLSIPSTRSLTGRLAPPVGCKFANVNDGAFVSEEKAVAAASWLPINSDTCWPVRRKGAHVMLNVTDDAEATDAGGGVTILGAIASGRPLVLKDVLFGPGNWAERR